MDKLKKAFTLLTVVNLFSCSTINQLSDESERVKVYGGTRALLPVKECPQGDCLELPFAFLLDTAILSITTPWSLYNLALDHKAEQKAQPDTYNASESLLGFNLGFGIGPRHAMFPSPLINLHVKLGEGQAFVELTGNIAAVMSSIGYRYPISHHSSLHLARVDAGTIDANRVSGYKFGYVYNSNGFSKSGWITSLELYSLPRFTGLLTPVDDSDTPTIYPTISVGYQW